MAARPAGRAKRPAQDALYTKELEKENARLHVQIAKHEVKQTTLENRVRALEKEMEKIRPGSGFTMNITHAGFDPKMPRERLEALLFEKAAELGYRLEKVVT